MSSLTMVVPFMSVRKTDRREGYQEWVMEQGKVFKEVIVSYSFPASPIRPVNPSL